MQTCFNHCTNFNTDTVAFIDIEGEYNDVCEVAIIALVPTIATAGCVIKEVIVIHAVPNNITSFHRASKYCHGLDLQQLRQIGLTDQQQVRQRAIEFILQYNISLIIGHDGPTSKVSDNENFLKLSGYTGHYHNHPLPSWIERSEAVYHKLAVHSKELPFGYRFNRAFKKARCKAQHNSQKIVINGNTETAKAKRETGAHCALADAYELFLFNREKYRQ